MATCSKCGKELKPKTKFCPDCGTKVETTKKDEKEMSETIKDSVEKVLDTEDTTKEFEKKDIKENMAMAVLSYIGVLALIPYFLEKRSDYVKYHSRQGMNLLVVWLGYAVISGLLSLIKVTKTINHFWGYGYLEVKTTPWWISLPIYLVGVAIGTLSVLGIVYACQGKAKELPVINKIKIFK